MWMFDRRSTLELKALSLTQLVRNALSDLFHLELDLCTVIGTNPFETLPGFIVTSNHGEPASRFLEGDHANAQKSTWQDL